MLRVVVLSKRHRLTEYMLTRFWEAGVLAGVVYETRLTSRNDQLTTLRRLAKKEGLLRAIDVAMYEMYDRLFRTREFVNATERILPLKPESVVGVRSVPTYDVESLNSVEARDIIRSLKPDVLVVHATAILKPETFSLARLAALNVHCGVLPKYRGHASTFWSVATGDHGNIGVSIHHVAPIVDTGSLVRLGRVPWQKGETDITLWCRALALGTELTLNAVQELEASGTLTTQPYEGEKGPHYPRKGFSDFIAYRLLGRARPWGRGRAPSLRPDRAS